MFGEDSVIGPIEVMKSLITMCTEDNTIEKGPMEVHLTLGSNWGVGSAINIVYYYCGITLRAKHLIAL